ncbi:MAG: zinc ribbon domain-containing protein [Lachnospiraceae bacterium]|nr:zinc ribbon domain-containing protein [Lachnospiraceae bacterium]
MFCPKCGKENQEGVKFCISCGEPLGGTTAAYAYDTPLNWAKFLGYFALWLSALLNFIGGVSAFGGSQYGDLKGLVYNIFPGMRAVDIIYGLLCIALAGLGGYCAYGIIMHKKFVVNYIPLLYAAAAGIVFVYSLVATIVVGQSCFSASIIVNIIVSVVMVFVNSVYFNKRKHIFVN